MLIITRNQCGIIRFNNLSAKRIDSRIWIILCILFILPLLDGTPARASVSKTTLKLSIQNQIDNILKNNKSVSSEDRIQIDRQSRLLVNTVDSLQIEDISSDLADWLISSYVYFVESKPNILFYKNSSDRNLFDDAVRRIYKRFKSLDNAKGQKLLALKNVFQDENKLYRSKLFAYAKNSVSSSSIVIVDVGRSIGGGSGTLGFTGVTASIGVNLLASANDQNTNQNTVDFSLDEVKSKLLCLAFINDVNSRLSEIELAARFTEGNIFSPIYDENSAPDPLKWRKFEAVQNELATLFSTSTTLNGTIVTVRLEPYLYLIGSAISLRWKDKIEGHKGTPDLHAFVEFQNDSNLWNLIQFP